MRTKRNRPAGRHIESHTAGALFGILVMLVLPLAATPEIAGATDVFTEDFDTFNDQIWSTFTYGNPGPFINEFADGRLHLKKACVCGGSAIKGGGLGARFLLHGDFTITVDLEWGIFRDRNQAQINISIPGLGFRYDMGHGNGIGVPAGQKIYFNYKPGDSPVGTWRAVYTDDYAGTLRLVRTGSLFTAYFRSPGSETFTQIPRAAYVTSADVRFQLILQNNYTDNITEVFYDNLVVEAEALIGLPEPGSIEGFVVADCPAPDTGLYGAVVGAFDVSDGPEGLTLGELVASALTDESGFYSIPDLDPADYYVSLVAPLGYTSDIQEVPVSVLSNQVVAADFSLACSEATGSQRGSGFWKHELAVAVGGKGNSQLDAETLCGYLDNIENHFNHNEINQVVVYDPPPSGLCADKLAVASALLNLTGRQEMIARARQHFMATLLNVAAGHAALHEIVSEDGATLSQAITHIDGLIDDPEGDHELAKNLAEALNRGETLDAGLIPLDTVNIAYRIGALPASRAVLEQNRPNPFNPMTTIRFSLSDPAPVTLSVYDVAGRLVRTLLAGEMRKAGAHDVVWTGTDRNGKAVAGGLYFYRLQTPACDETRSMTLLK